MTTTSYRAVYRTTPETLSDDTIQTYRRQGFVHIPGVISPDEVAVFRAAALDAAQRLKDKSNTAGSKAERVFLQLVNVCKFHRGIQHFSSGEGSRFQALHTGGAGPRVRVKRQTRGPSTVLLRRYNPC